MDWLHIIIHAIKETAILLPFLYLTYLLLEWIEHHGAEKMEGVLQKQGKFAPLCGAFLGLVPQCGFSASAAGLYSARVISLGTLLAVFLSTSDEMIPILIAGRIPATVILLLLGIKLVVALAVGYGVDAFYRPKSQDHHHHIGEMCEEEHCHCEKGIWISSLLHTLQIAGFIFLVNFSLSILLEWVGEGNVAAWVSGSGIWAYFTTALLGLIPNCASSVILAELYAAEVILPGMMLAGLLPGAGIAGLVLLRTNRSMKQSVLILGLLLVIGIAVGSVTDLIWGIFA